LVDEPSPTLVADDVLGQLAAWRVWLEQPTSLAPPDQTLATRVAPALLAYRVPPAYLQMLVDGVASDVTRAEIRSWLELRAYCVLVASSIGLAMCHLLGAGDDPLAREAAVELGIAMQLTNILRDVGADLRAGRVYLPTDDLAAHGYSPRRLDWLATCVARSGAPALDEEFRNLMRAQIARARAHYARGMNGVSRLPDNCRLAILLAARLYQAILDEIEAADYDVFTRRAATSTCFKVVESIRCAFALRQPARSSAGFLPRGRSESAAVLTDGAAEMMPLVRS
ncbi:MAG TPA: phytoene/squalene synthase family protein, partial [Burkholderiaceae bacterium]